MLADFMIGSTVGVAVMLVHLLSTLLIYWFVHKLCGKVSKNRVLYLVLSLIVLYIMLFVCLCSSVSIWAGVYYHMGFVDNFADAFYTAMLNYTTLGYGDLNQVAKTRLFGPMAAASGILMFGWAAALLVYIIQLHLPTILKNKWGN
jgi:hypothetical protein